GSNSPDEGVGVGVDGAGNTVIGATVGNRVDFGAGMSPAGATAVITQFGSNGNAHWSRPLVAGIAGVGVDGGGNVLAAGNFAGTVDFGGQSVTQQGTGRDLYVAKYSSGNALQWVRAAVGGVITNAVAADASGNVAVAGHFSGASLVFTAPGSPSITLA